MGSKAPDPPDPYKVADAQTGTNIATAKAQQQIGMTGLTGPTSSVSYVLDPSSPSGYRQVTQYSPEMQALLDQAQGNAAQFGSVVGQQTGRVGDSLATPFSMDAGRGKVLSDINQTMMDPLWQHNQDAFETSMANQGIRPGSEEYQLQKRQFDQGKDDAYNKMFLSSYGQANDAALKQYELPMQMYQMLTSAGSGAAMPAPPNTPATSSPGVAPTDLTGAVNSAYQGQVANANASLSGLYGLGAAGLGGWAKAGFPGAGALLAMI